MISAAESTTKKEFAQIVTEGIPNLLPSKPVYNTEANHAPVRKDILSASEKQLALRNALRYFPAHMHAELAPEFAQELKSYGRIFMYRFRPTHEMFARPIDWYPAKCQQAAAIMLMIQNNLDPRVAQHPHELITYGGNGAVFQNWAQYRLTMKYLSEMGEDQTLVMYSGHPMGLFPSHRDAPRVVVTNGMMIPNYSKQDDWEKYNALGVTQYGQMTAGSYMYIGPQGIVHGTTITVMNAARKLVMEKELNAADSGPMLFVTSGLGGMSGAQPKAGNIAGVISVTAEVNSKAAHKRHDQGWVDEIYEDLDKLCGRINIARSNKEVVSLAYIGNIVDLWEKLDDEDILVDIGSDQTSLHNPWAGGYYPVGLSYEESNDLMASDPGAFKDKVQETLRQHADVINRHARRGMYFFDYGNAFLLEASRAGGDVMMMRPRLHPQPHLPHPQPLSKGEGSAPLFTDEFHQGEEGWRTSDVKQYKEKKHIARELRRTQTKAEELLWESLRAKKLGGYKFRRQHVIGPYIVDFVCLEKNLIVEVDGGIHLDAEEKQYDLDRTDYLEQEHFFHVIRFTNDEVETKKMDVLEQILDQCNKRQSHISRHADFRNKPIRDEQTPSPLLWRGAGGEVNKAEAGETPEFRYPSYVQDILGPMCFDYGFGPFRWVCCSGKAEDLEKTDRIAQEVLERLKKNAPPEIQQQMADNIKWISEAGKNKLVVGSQARILYADANGRIEIAKAFNDAIAKGDIGPVVLGRDHHDVSGTDSPFRETSNIYDGSRFTADMAVHNFVGDSFRGATWVSLHNGGGVGWGEVINGGFGMLLDGSADSERRLKSMLHWDVNNGIARRAWARNKEALFAIERAMEQEPKLKVTLPNIVDDDLLNSIKFSST